jgi:hypothetical protein
MMDTVEWTEREEEMLRQCVFENAYDFTLAAISLGQRLPKQRKLALNNGQNIDAVLCEQQWLRICARDDKHNFEENEDDSDSRVILMNASEASLKILNTPRLELPLSESEVDVLLHDIASSNTDRSSEMQWVLSYLEDPANAVGDNDDMETFLCDPLPCSNADQNDQNTLFQSLDMAFQERRERSQNNKSFEAHNDSNIVNMDVPRASKDMQDSPRIPTLVVREELSTSLFSKKEPHTQDAVPYPVTQFPPAAPLVRRQSVPSDENVEELHKNRDKASTQGSPWHIHVTSSSSNVDTITQDAEDQDAHSDASSSDIEADDWRASRRRMKDRLKHQNRCQSAHLKSSSGPAIQHMNSKNGADDDASSVSVMSLSK